MAEQDQRHASAWLSKVAPLLLSLSLPIATLIVRLIRRDDPMFFVVFVLLSGAMLVWLTAKTLLQAVDKVPRAPGRKVAGFTVLVVIAAVTAWLAWIGINDLEALRLEVSTVHWTNMIAMAAHGESTQDGEPLFSINFVVESRRNDDLLLDRATLHVQYATYLEPCEPGSIEHASETWSAALDPCAQQSVSIDLDVQSFSGMEVPAGRGREYSLYLTNAKSLCPSPWVIPDSVAIGIYKIELELTFDGFDEDLSIGPMWIAIPQGGLGYAISDSRAALEGWLRWPGLSPNSAFEEPQPCSCRNALRIEPIADEILAADEALRTDLVTGIAERILELRASFPDLFAAGDDAC